VEAVNNYEPLLAAARAVCEAWDAYLEESFAPDAPITETIDALRALVAGEEPTS
jgi:hypothetical protein